MVADTGSVTAAARVLHISQPALSKQLKIFENSLDTKLFEKQGRGLQLTSTGLSLFGQCRGIFEKARYLSREFSSTPSIAREQIRIGIGSSIERSFASNVIGEFFNLASDTDKQKYSISASSLNGDTLNRHLNEQIIDACITERRLSGSNILAVASATTQLCFIFPAKFTYRLKGIKTESLRAAVSALDLPWIVPTTNLRFRQDVEKVLDKHRLDLRPILETDSMMTIVRSVENGIGIAIVPKLFCGTTSEHRRLGIIDKNKFAPEISLTLWVRRADKDREFVKRLVKAFQRSVKV